MDEVQLNQLISDLNTFFSDRPDVEAAAVFGSVARRADTVASDVDLMVVGDLSELRLNADLRPMSRKYGLPINAGVWTSSELQWLITEGNDVIRSILSSPIIIIRGSIPTTSNDFKR